MPSSRLIVFAAALGLAVAAPVAAQTIDRRVAITIDDLPSTGGPDSLGRVRQITRALLSVLRKHAVPASGFVVGERVLVEGETDARLGLLRQWVDAGMRLENHGFSHLSLNRVPFRSYGDDIVRGDLVLRLVEPGDSTRFYRAPFNHTGRDSTVRADLLRFLRARGYRLAPFTVEASDYLYDAIYRDALAHGDTMLAGRARRTYLDHTDRAMAFFDALARETFGRAIPQILLFHANDLNADALDDLLSMLERHGYAYVSLDEAVRDSAYATRDGYFGAYGPSWLHRWRITLGLENRLPDEPDVPPWALEKYRAAVAAPGRARQR